MNAVFKAQVDYSKQAPVPRSEIRSPKERYDWTDKENIKKSVLYQNQFVEDGRFDPVQYFGGCKPQDVGTGIIRKITAHMFAKEPVKRNVRPSPDPNQTVQRENKNMMPKARKPKASHSQAELEASKCTSLAEISCSLQTSQSRINQLMNNLKSMKCTSKEDSINAKNNSYLKYCNPKYKKIKKHKSALWSNPDSTREGKSKPKKTGGYSQTIANSIQQLKNISDVTKKFLVNAKQEYASTMSIQPEKQKFRTKLKLCGSNDRTGYDKDVTRLLSESTKQCMTIVPDSSTDRSGFTMHNKTAKYHKKSQYSKLKNGLGGKKDLGGYSTLLEYLDKPIQQYSASGNETPGNISTNRCKNIKTEIKTSKGKLKSGTPVNNIEKKFVVNKSKCKKRMKESSVEGKPPKDMKRSNTRSKSKHSKSKQKMKSKSKASVHPLSQRANSVEHQSIDSALDMCRKMKKSLKKLNSSKLSTYFKKCKAKAKAMHSKTNSSVGRDHKTHKSFGQRAGSVDVVLNFP